MKKYFLFLLLSSGFIQAQTSEYEVSSYLLEGFKAPNTNYLGEAWLNPAEVTNLLIKEGLRIVQFSSLILNLLFRK